MASGADGNAMAAAAAAEENEDAQASAAENEEGDESLQNSELEGEEDDGEEGEEGEEDDGDESETGQSEQEEEDKYADQPACGLSPQLVVRRGVQHLQNLEAGRSVQVEGPDDQAAPPLQRIDTIASFERAVGRTLEASEGLTSPNPGVPSLSRITTMTGLPEVQEAFAAVGEEEAAAGGGGGEHKTPSASAGASSSSSSALNVPVPSVVHRVDTMELLLDPNAADEAGSRPQKRTKL